MAIARIANSALENTTGTSLTFSHTVDAGSNRVLFVGVLENAAGFTSTRITSVTFNGDAMSMLVQEHRVGGTQGFVSSIWFLAAPDVATGDVVITMTNSTDVYATAANYTGASQTAPTGDACKGFASESAANATMNPVSIADDSWAFSFFRNIDGAISDGTNYVGFNHSSVECGDSNAGMGTAGTETVTGSTAGATRWGGCVTAAFAPASAPAPSDTGNMFLMF